MSGGFVLTAHSSIVFSCSLSNFMKCPALFSESDPSVKNETRDIT